MLQNASRRIPIQLFTVFKAVRFVSHYQDDSVPAEMVSVENLFVADVHLTTAVNQVNAIIALHLNQATVRMPSSGSHGRRDLLRLIGFHHQSGVTGSAPRRLELRQSVTVVRAGGPAGIMHDHFRVRHPDHHHEMPQLGSIHANNHRHQHGSVGAQMSSDFGQIRAVPLLLLFQAEIMFQQIPEITHGSQIAVIVFGAGSGLR